MRVASDGLRVARPHSIAIGSNRLDRIRPRSIAIAPSPESNWPIHAVRHAQHAMQMLGHQLHAQHLDFGRKLRDPSEVRFHRAPEIAQPHLRTILRNPAEKGIRAVIEHQCNQIGAGAAVIPIAAPSPHVVDRIAHPCPRVGIHVPSGRQLDWAFVPLHATSIADRPRAFNARRGLIAKSHGVIIQSVRQRVGNLSEPDDNRTLCILQCFVLLKPENFLPNEPCRGRAVWHSSVTLSGKASQGLKRECDGGVPLLHSCGTDGMRRSRSSYAGN